MEVLSSPAFQMMCLSDLQADEHHQFVKQLGLIRRTVWICCLSVAKRQPIRIGIGKDAGVSAGSDGINGALRESTRESVARCWSAEKSGIVTPGFLTMALDIVGKRR